MSKYGTTLARLVSKHGLRVVLVAKAVGVSRQTIYTWIRGTSVPGGKALARLLAHLQVHEPTLTLRRLMHAPRKPRRKKEA